MGIIWTIIIGLLAGIVAKFLMPGRDPGGLIITILLGIAGAFVATYLGQAIGWYQAGEGAGLHRRGGRRDPHPDRLPADERSPRRLIVEPRGPRRVQARRLSDR